MFCEPTFSGKLTQEMTSKRDLIGSQKRANQRLSMILEAISESTPRAFLGTPSGDPHTQHSQPNKMAGASTPARVSFPVASRSKTPRTHRARFPLSRTNPVAFSFDFLRFRVTKKPPPLTPSSPFHVKRQARAIFLPVSAASAVRPAACPPAACPACPPALPST